MWERLMLPCVCGRGITLDLILYWESCLQQTEEQAVGDGQS
jgi:hypothetical protein